MDDLNDFALVRAFGDEPRRLRASWDDNGTMLVYGTDDESIPYPSVYVYEFDSQLYADLRAAYSRGDAAALSQLWGRARVLRPLAIA
jgi:hypothetical protein